MRHEIRKRREGRLRPVRGRERQFPRRWRPGAAAGLFGRGRALEVVLGSNDFDATTADHYGIINRALPDDQVDDFVNDLARRLCLFDREAYAPLSAKLTGTRCR